MGRAIVRDPAAFLMDEPLSNLDAKLRVQMRTTISRLQQRLGTTTVYVTHDQVEAMTLGDRVAVLRRGEVQQVASPRELYSNPANLFVAGFIGSPAMNLLPGELDGAHLHLPMVDLELPDTVRQRMEEGASGKVIAGLRPESFEDAALVSDPEAPGGTFTAKIDVIEWLGSEMFAHFEVEGAAAAELEELAEDLETVRIGTADEQAQIVARLDTQSDAEEQSEQEMWVDARAVHLFDPDSGRSLVRPERGEATTA